jgi:hypothetical protein
MSEDTPDTPKDPSVCWIRRGQCFLDCPAREGLTCIPLDAFRAVRSAARLLIRFLMERVKEPGPPLKRGMKKRHA